MRNPFSKKGFVGSLFRHPKKLLPIVGSIIGSAIGGPMGGTIGGSLGGALSNKNRLQGAFSGGLSGYGIGSFAPYATSALGMNNLAGLSGNPLMGSGGGGLAQLLGAAPFGGGMGGGSGAMGGRDAAFSALRQAGKGGGGGLGSSMLGGFGSGGGGGLLSGIMGNPLQSALLATSIGGTLSGRQKVPKDDTSLEEIIAKSRAASKGDTRELSVRPFNRRVRRIEGPVDPSGREEDYFEEFPVQGYASGGYVQGSNGGQSDKFRTTVPENGFVMDSFSNSLLGDGNSSNGAHKWAEFEKRFLGNHSGFMNNESHGNNITVDLSDGESYIPPKVVKSIGKGSYKKGAQDLNKFRKNLRKQKGVPRRTLLPKSKPIEKYLGK